MFLVDVARFKESVIPLNLFDVGKKVSLDFLCITAERVSYADPGMLYAYDVVIGAIWMIFRLQASATSKIRDWCFRSARSASWRM